MTPERWQHIKEIVQTALDQPPSQQKDFIQTACGSDTELHREVGSLMGYHAKLGDFLAEPLSPWNREDTPRLEKDSVLTPGTILQQRYKIIGSIGQGGMGAVYQAQDHRLNQIVALKQTLVSGDKLVKAFQREAQLLAKLRSSSLPRVIDYFFEADGQFLVMEFIAGDNLADLLKQKSRPFEVAQVLAWADQLLEVLDYLHNQEPPIVHHDIKPHNLKLTSSGEIVLLDFGLAKGTAKSTNNSISSIVGYTPHYAPLEQINGLGTDPRSDLYALAATLYHLMTGVKPIDASQRAAALVDGQPDPLPLAHTLNLQISVDLAHYLQQVMSQSLHQRPINAAEMRAALANLSQQTEATTAISGGLTTYKNSVVTNDKTQSILANRAETFNWLDIKSRLQQGRYLVVAVGLLFLTMWVGYYYQYKEPATLLAVSPAINNTMGAIKNGSTTPISQGQRFGDPSFVGDLISIDIKDVSLYDVLRFFSDNYNLNFIIDESVPKIITTVKANDVPWNQVLESALNNNNLAYKREGSILRIFPRDRVVNKEVRP